MSIETFEEEAVTHHRFRSSSKNFLGVVRSVPDMRRLMEREHFNFPVYIRFDPDDINDERLMERLDQVFRLLSAAKDKNAIGEDGRKLFVYRNTSNAKSVSLQGKTKGRGKAT